MPKRSSSQPSLFEDQDLALGTPSVTRSIRADVAPEVLRWARESAGVEIATVARRFPKIRSWETGSEKPSVPQLETLSELYKRPLVTFFLSSPPSEPPLPTDFRILPSQDVRRLSKRTLVAMRTARRIQRLYANLAPDFREAPSSRLPRMTIGDNPEEQATKVRRILGVTPDMQRSWRDAYTAWRHWRSVLEQLGVLVLQLSMPTREVRGFSLTDGLVPTITVTSSDAVVARMFTLFHELGHLLLETGGLCLPDPARVSQDHAVEPFCNQFAGAVLMPLSILRDEEALQSIDRESTDTEVEFRIVGVANAYKVSRWVALFRMLAAGLVSRARVERLIERFDKTGVPEKSGGPVAPAVRVVNQYGTRFVSMVLEAHARNVLTTSDVVDFLSLRVKHLPRLQQIVAAQRG